LPKTYIRITQPTTSPPAKSLTSPATMHEGQDQLPASLAARIGMCVDARRKGSILCFKTVEET
jgi:hypothetical protein